VAQINKERLPPIAAYTYITEGKFPDIGWHNCPLFGSNT